MITPSKLINKATILDQQIEEIQSTKNRAESDGCLSQFLQSHSYNTKYSQQSSETSQNEVRQFQQGNQKRWKERPSYFSWKKTNQENSDKKFSDNKLETILTESNKNNECSVFSNQDKPKGKAYSSEETIETKSTEQKIGETNFLINTKEEVIDTVLSSKYSRKKQSEDNCFDQNKQNAISQTKENEIALQYYKFHRKKQPEENTLEEVKDQKFQKIEVNFLETVKIDKSPVNKYFCNNSTKDKLINTENEKDLKHMKINLSQEKIQQELIFPEKPDSQYNYFKKLKFLGRGKFSDVFLARDIRSNFFVALKVIKKEIIWQNKMVKQIAEEIKIQHLLLHPNIVRLYTFFQNDSEIILVLEYCAQGDLYEYLNKQSSKKLSECEASSFVKQIASAVKFLHGNEIIHRDIKPENIFLNENIPKLADFSLSVYEPNLFRQTQCGSLVYQSPEIVFGVRYNKKCDVWALGILAYELCSGQTPWDSFDFNEKQEAIKQCKYSCPSFFSESLSNFLSNTLMKNPNMRFSSRQVLGHRWINQKIIVAKEISEFQI